MFGVLFPIKKVHWKSVFVGMNKYYVSLYFMQKKSQITDEIKQILGHLNMFFFTLH